MKPRIKFVIGALIAVAGFIAWRVGIKKIKSKENE